MNNCDMRGEHAKKTLESTTAISRKPNVVSGAAVFPRTRIPVYLLFNYLATGESIDDFLAGYDGLSRDECAAVVDLARDIICDDDFER